MAAVLVLLVIASCGSAARPPSAPPTSATPSPVATLAITPKPPLSALTVTVLTQRWRGQFDEYPTLVSFENPNIEAVDWLVIFFPFRPLPAGEKQTVLVTADDWMAKGTLATPLRTEVEVGLFDARAEDW